MAKEKVMITIDGDLLRDVDDYCDRNYINRSLLISQSLLQVLNQQKVIDAIQNVSLALKKVADSGSIDDDTKKQMEYFENLSKYFLK